jgi:hypothetical protein
VEDGRGDEGRQSRGRRWQRGRRALLGSDGASVGLRVEEERMTKKDKGGRGAAWLLDENPTAVHVD